MVVYQCKICGNYGNFKFLIEHMFYNHRGFLKYCGETIIENDDNCFWEYNEEKIKNNQTFWKVYNPKDKFFEFNAFPADNIIIWKRLFDNDC